MKISIQCIKSLSSGGFLTQLHSCYNQLKLVEGHTTNNRRILKITVFSACADNQDYAQKMKVLKYVLDQFVTIQAPVSFVSQPPMDGKILIEAWILDYKDTGLTFTFKRESQVSVLQLDSLNYSCLIASQYSEMYDSFKQNAGETFKLLDSTLLESNFDYSDIVRQWNYIEDITLEDVSGDRSLQNYQIFNDLRALFYEKSTFTAGYPSATGIGIKNGGCTIEIIALKEKRGNDIFPITNTHQVDAHSYSSNVLTGEYTGEVKTISTPKFERGKFMKFRKEGFLFISGTASIIGENTVYPEDVTKQTLTTIENIDHLISFNNSNHCNKKIDSIPKLKNYRVYLKNEQDYDVVKALCDAHFGIKKGIFIKADSCRSNLLVEIEANYLF